MWEHWTSLSLAQLKPERPELDADTEIEYLTFFFQAEDGIRDKLVTGVQTCALPISGLDPKQINETRDLIKSLAGDHTIILSTHILPEVEQTCERVIIINKGKLVATDSVHNLQNRARGAESVLVEVAGRNGALDSATVQQRLAQISGVTGVLLKERRDSRAIFEVETRKGGLVRGDLARAVVESGWDLNELRPAARSLEEVFLQLVGDESQAGGTAASGQKQ